MPRPKLIEDGPTKIQPHRQQRRGMKLLRVWMPDPNRPEFAAEAKRQGLILRGRAEEVEALSFIAAAFDR